ncbi:MAG: ATP-binding cassette domain-containing protein [Rhizobiaceae bacterium]
MLVIIPTHDLKAARLSTSAPSPNSDDQLLVALHNVGVNRDGRWLIRGIDINVRRGEIVTLVGPNGSGKSTSAKVALGIIKPDEGSVQRAPGLRVGYVPQKFDIESMLPLTVTRLLNLTAHHKKHEISEALKLVGAGEHAQSRVQSLSGGEFQRVMMARAMLRKPDLLVLDEPAQGVDFSGEIALYDLIKDIRNQTQCGVLLISHDLHLVMAETDVVICLNGHVCCTGSPQAVSESAEYRELFGARAVEGLAVYQHHHDHTHLPDGKVRHSDGSITDHCHPDDGHHHD